MARGFPAGFERVGREGYVIEFFPDTPDAWIGNFAPGHGSVEGIHRHHNGTDLVVFSSGRGYVVDPRTRQLKEEVGEALLYVWAVADPPGFVIDDAGVGFIRLGPDGGTYWQTRRLSWDGLKDVVFDAARITGLGWVAAGDMWLPFEVDVATGRSRGGGYTMPDAVHWERLAPPSS